MINDQVISIKNISKRYRLGHRKKSDTLYGQVIDVLTSPFRNLKNIRGLKNFSKTDTNILWALNEVSFDIKKGEVVGIIGRNGAGKSTLLKILSRITEPTSGEIIYKGKVSSLLEIGTGFHAELSGRDNIYMNGAILGMTKIEIEKKFDEIVAFAGIEKHIDTPVKFYSSGMKVRIGFAVAAHLEPDILVIDEVLAVGDLAFQQKCLGKMDSVSQSGRTILFVSHDMSAVEGLCHRCIVLDEGKIIFNGDTMEAIQTYRNNTIEKSSSISLKDRKDRKGNGHFRFTSIVLNDHQPVELNQPLNIKLGYTANRSFEEIRIAIKICRSYRDVVMNFDSQSQGVNISITKGTGKIELTIPQLTLMPNTYLIDLVASLRKPEDLIHNVCSFEVATRDAYGSGKINKGKNRGLVLAPKALWSNTQH